MTSKRWRFAACFALTFAISALARPSEVLAQDKPKDEALEKLLEKLDEKDKPAPDKPKEADKPAPEKPKDTGKPADKPKPAGTVTPKDQELDKLLEGLGETKDKPSPDDKKPPGGPGPDDPMPPQEGKPKPDSLEGGEKDLDKALERITGKKDKPKNQKQRKQEEETGPLGKVIKEMRDVEERLGQPDTGEETRKKQTEIVKNLDQLIEQMKNAPSQSQGLKMIREGKKPGDQPGPQKGDQTGAMAQGAQASKPTDPKKPPIPQDLIKSIWGQLPDQVRDQMGNVMNERPLPTRLELIRQYYLSLGAKNSNRGE